MQPYGRAINPPAPNPTKPLKRNMDEEASHRPAVTKPSNVQPSGEAKRRKTDDEHNPMQAVRPTMPPPIRQSNIRKVRTHCSIASLKESQLTSETCTALYVRTSWHGSPLWLFNFQECPAPATRSSHG